jgi:hypothetical protein
MSDLILPTDVFCPCLNRAFAAIMMFVCCCPFITYNVAKESLCDNCCRDRPINYENIHHD